MVKSLCRMTLGPLAGIEETRQEEWAIDRSPEILSSGRQLRLRSIALSFIVPEQHRDFKGIWIPREIWLSEDLTIGQKVMLAEIWSLEHPEKGCYASNDYFAGFFRLSERQVSRVINELIEKGYVSSSIDQSAYQKRVLRIVQSSGHKRLQLWTNPSTPVDTDVQNLRTEMSTNILDHNKDITRRGADGDTASGAVPRGSEKATEYFASMKDRMK